MFAAATQKHWEVGRNFNKQTLLSSFLSPTPTLSYIVVVSVDTSLPGAGPLTKYFHAVRRKAKGSSRAFCFLKIISRK